MRQSRSHPGGGNATPRTGPRPHPRISHVRVPVMGGSIRCCPNCGEYVLPPAVQVVRLDGPPYEKAECVSCGWFGFTEDLRLKFIPTMLVAEPTRPTPQNTFFAVDGSAAELNNPTTTATTSPAFTPGPDELVVVCVSTYISPIITGVTCGGTPMVLAESLTHHQGIVRGEMWYLESAPQVSSQIEVSFDDVDSSHAISVLRFQGYHSLVHTSSNDEDGTDFNSNFTPTQPQTGCLAVGMNASNANYATAPIPPDAFLGVVSVAKDALVGVDGGGPAFVGVFNSHKFLGSDTSASRYFGNSFASVDHVSIVAVFKP